MYSKLPRIGRAGCLTQHIRRDNVEIKARCGISNSVRQDRSKKIAASGLDPDTTYIAVNRRENISRHNVTRLDHSKHNVTKLDHSKYNLGFTLKESGEKLIQMMQSVVVKKKEITTFESAAGIFSQVEKLLNSKRLKVSLIPSILQQLKTAVYDKEFQHISWLQQQGPQKGFALIAQNGKVQECFGRFHRKPALQAILGKVESSVHHLWPDQIAEVFNSLVHLGIDSSHPAIDACLSRMSGSCDFDVHSLAVTAGALTYHPFAEDLLQSLIVPQLQRRCTEGVTMIHNTQSLVDFCELLIVPSLVIDYNVLSWALGEVGRAIRENSGLQDPSVLTVVGKMLSRMKFHYRHDHGGVQEYLHHIVEEMEKALSDGDIIQRLGPSEVCTLSWLFYLFYLKKSTRHFSIRKLLVERVKELFHREEKNFYNVTNLFVSFYMLNHDDQFEELDEEIMKLVPAMDFVTLSDMAVVLCCRGEQPRPPVNLSKVVFNRIKQSADEVVKVPDCSIIYRMLPFLRATSVNPQLLKKLEIASKWPTYISPFPGHYGITSYFTDTTVQEKKDDEEFRSSGSKNQLVNIILQQISKGASQEVNENKPTLATFFREMGTVLRNDPDREDVYAYSKLLKDLPELSATLSSYHDLRSLWSILYKLKYYNEEVMENIVTFVETLLINHGKEISATVTKIAELLSFIGYNLDKNRLCTYLFTKTLFDMYKVPVKDQLRHMMALCILDVCPEERLKQMFTVQDLKEIDNLLESLNRVPAAQRHILKYVYMLNRFAVVMLPHLEIPYLFEHNGLFKRPTFPGGPLENEVHKALADVLGGKQYIGCNTVSKYAHLIKFQCLFDGKKPVAYEENKNNPDLLRVAVHTLQPDRLCFNSSRPLGAHLLLDRELQAMGYRTINVTFPEWYSMKLSEPNSKRDYLARKFACIT